MADKRFRAKGRFGGDGERFARLTDSLLQCEAVRTLPPRAFHVLTILTVGARGPRAGYHSDHGHNGVQAVTDTYARRYGINSRDTVYRSIRELIERQLIVRTREGWRSKDHFATYAVAWLPITHRDGQPLDRAEPAPNGFWDWQPTAPKPKKTMPSRKNLPSDGRTQSRPRNGHDQVICRPTMSRDETNCPPMVGNTLRVLAAAPPVSEAEVAHHEY